MPIPVPVAIATGFADLVGSSYRVATDQLYAADAGSGEIVAVNAHTHAKTVLGTGYNAPSDVARWRRRHPRLRHRESRDAASAQPHQHESCGRDRGSLGNERRRPGRPRRGSRLRVRLPSSPAGTSSAST